MEDWGEEREENAIKLGAVESLGLGFDLTSDFRLKFAKKERLVVLDQTHKRSVVLPFVSVDIRCDKGGQMQMLFNLIRLATKSCHTTFKFEAVWALTNMASDTSERTRVVIKHGVVPKFVQLLASVSDDV